MVNLLQKYVLRALNQAGLIGGYLVAFTGPHLRDSFNQFFTANTDFGLDKTGPNRPVNYHHNLSWLKGDIGNIQSIEVRADGLYATAQLNTDHEAWPFVRSELEAGKLGFSVETIPTEGYFKANADGHVDRFWVFGAAISPAASAPKRLTSVAALRAAGAAVDGEGDIEMSLRGIWDIKFPVVQTPPSGAGVAYADIPQANRQAVTALPQSASVPNLRGLSVSGMADLEVDGPPLRDVLAYVVMNDQTSQKGRRKVQPSAEFMRGLFGRFSAELVKDFKSDQPRFLRADADSGMPGDLEIFADMVGVGVGKNAYLRANELSTSAAAGYGDEWVYTAFNQVLWRDIMLQSRIMGALDNFNMPSNPYDYPVVGAGPSVRRLTENANQSVQAWTASPYTLTRMATSGKTFRVVDRVGAAALWTYEFQNYAQIDKMAAFTQSFVDQFAIAMDRMLLHGDEAATATNIGHYGADPTGTAYDYQMVVDGLRDHCLVVASGQSASHAGAAITYAAFNTARTRMGVLGINPDDLIAFVNPALYFSMLGLTELKTLDVFGPQATVLTGQIGAIGGMPVIVSSELELANASGQLPSAHNGTLSQILLVNRRAVKVGRLVDFTIKTGEVDASDAMFIKAYTGFDVQVMQSTGVSYTYNIL
jgi:hypothetical protein